MTRVSTSTSTAFPVISPTPAGTISPIVGAPVIRQLYMLDMSSGWALGAPYLLRTLDGGQTWHDVTPPGAASAITGAFFLDVRLGWVTTNLQDFGPGTLFHTTDGGATWASFPVPFSGGDLGFLDESNGFVMVPLDAAMNKQSVAIYRTLDGGGTWTRMFVNDPTVPDSASSLPLAGHKLGLTFRDATHGWIGGSLDPVQAFSYLYATSDSGATWTQVLLPLPAGYETAFISMESPIFFGPNNAVLPVSLVLNTNVDLFIYSSHDGGSTWTISSGFARGAGYQHTDFVSPDDGFSWDWSGVFHVTHNAGATWTAVTPDVDFTANLSNMDFISTSTGWVVTRELDGSSSLYKTGDGGQTWTLLSSSQTVPSASVTP